MAIQQRLSLPRTSTNGFVALDNNENGNMEEIPMTKVRSQHSTNWDHNGEGSIYKSETHKEQPMNVSPGGGNHGRRKLAKLNSSGLEEKNVSLTGMGKIYDKIIKFSVVTRYMVYVVPVAAILAIPITLGATTAKETRIGGMRMLWFFIWVELVWLSIWIAKLFAQFVPYVFLFLCGVVSPGTRKYARILRNLEFPLSFVGWAVATNCTFKVLSDRSDNIRMPWFSVMQQILGAALIGSLIYLVEKVIIQVISISYHQRSFDDRIQQSKRNVLLIGLLYDASRSLFPMYCQEFADEDYAISSSFQGAAGLKGKTQKRSGAATPMRLLNGIVRVGDKVTSAFGNVATEIAGKQVFSPNSAHSIVIEALEKKKSSEALATRIWLSFVVEGAEALSLEDIREVLGPQRRDEADEAFYAMDVDGNDDVSLDEMVMKVVGISRERKAIAKSMHDIGGAISVLDSVLSTVALVIIVFIFVAFLNANFVTTLATAGTTLLSMSFVFAVTCQEFLGSCIFLFIKHPYDVGDRVDIQGPEKEQLVVMQISLLYTVFKRIDYMKMVQVPNIVLNTMWIENVTRSSAMKEQFELSISFDTTLEDIELLRAEMEAFVQHTDNSRDFQPEIIIECAGVGNMDKLVLKAEIRHKSNWSNESVRASRRSKFICALVLALRKIPIYGPGGGYEALGAPGNPTYSVAVSDEEAEAARAAADKAKEEMRMVSSAPPASDDAANGEKSGVLGAGAEGAAAVAMNSRGPADDEARDNSSGSTFDGGMEESGLDHRRSRDLGVLRDGLMKRASTRGKRRTDMPTLTTSGLSTKASLTQSLSNQSPTVGKRQQNPLSPNMTNPQRIDEEAEVGAYGSGQHVTYGQPSQNPAPAYGGGQLPFVQPAQNASPYGVSTNIQGGNVQGGNVQQGMGQGQGPQQGSAYNDFPTSQQQQYGQPQPPRK